MHTDTMKQKSLDALHYIIKDAGEAARAMATMGNYQAECKYLDQVNDACTELHRRKTARGK